MNILVIGDVVGVSGCEFLKEKLPKIKIDYEVDLTIANGENSAEGNGVTDSSVNFLLNSGVDVITSGNHAFRRRGSRDVYKNNDHVIRPANYPKYTTPGKGYCYATVNGTEVLIINVLGVTFLESLNSPAETIDHILKINNNKVKVIIVDLHAEATAEKRALGFYLDGRVSAIFGTHTHVQTSDECILENGTGYITDVGMTGAIHSVLGIKPEIVIRRTITHLPEKFMCADGPQKIECAIFNIDEKTGKTNAVKRLRIV